MSSERVSAACCNFIMSSDGDFNIVWVLVGVWGGGSDKVNLILFGISYIDI